MPQAVTPGLPPPNCPLCPRLAAFRDTNRDRYPQFHNGPVPPFGPPTARLLVVGLAPGLKGANQTGRPFTGDYAGDLLYSTLAAFGFSRGDYGASPDDGLALNDCRIINAVRCVPPENKPTGAEVATCRRFLAAEIAAMPDLTAIVALGQVAHRAVIATFGLRQAAYPFGHGARHDLETRHIRLTDSYHCSRYNTNTGRLTTSMFHDVFAAVRRDLSGVPPVIDAR
ncbi:uracil-DNA glycosylase [Fodinicurvata sp. EGI_FJ10296]|uniref:uracil-DNA glycosylase n=1 Tax=Fodinicurvata sp. EGI_FJ10296 TaxID=3231908 RepID=UPI003454C878